MHDTVYNQFQQLAPYGYLATLQMTTISSVLSIDKEGNDVKMKRMTFYYCW